VPEFRNLKLSVLLLIHSGSETFYPKREITLFKIIRLVDLFMTEQKKILDCRFTEWKGAQEQVDDVCVTGVRI
jgi:hypothetical protein